MGQALSQSPREGADAEIEVRQLYDIVDFRPSEEMERFRDMGMRTKA